MNRTGSTYKLSIIAAIVISAICCLLASCSKDEDFNIGEKEGAEGAVHGCRTEYEETRKVLLLYACGFNSLYSDLIMDMDQELPNGLVPGTLRSDDVILVYSKVAKSDSYKPVNSYLRRLYMNASGEVVSDTLRTFGPEICSADPETMKEVLEYTKKKFPARSYGMVFSSHGSGWLPQNYYFSPSGFERQHAWELTSPSGWLGKNCRPYAPIPTENMEDDPFGGMVRSIGMEEPDSDGNSGLKEMSTTEFASAIPFKLDFILFDMCFSAGIELFWALKDKASYIGGSSAEVLADGMFDYEAIASYIFNKDGSDLKGLMSDSFDRYANNEYELKRSATVSLVDTEGLDEVAEICKELFDKYRDEIAGLNYERVQGYYRLKRHYFFDLLDIIDKCGASEEDRGRLANAIGKCMVYENATPSFLNDFNISKTSHCGMTSYLPCAGTALLDLYYRKESWNQAVNLVK